MSALDFELRPVDITNYHQVMKLELKPGQELFVRSNANALAEAAYVPDMTADAIHAAVELVGLVSWCGYRPDYAFEKPPELGSYAIEHLMIAAPFQGRGLGRQVIAEIITRLSALPDCRRVVLSVHPDNAAAKHLYVEAGFRQFAIDRDGDALLELIVR